ncbi:B12-binding domain-containing radical SAM protein [bacterium]|nr:B12-binding domain-containing radical SAM protein [bacterium]
MKITLVAPASSVSRRRPGHGPRGTSYFHYYKLGLATIAAATPAPFEIETIDEVLDVWDPKTHRTGAVAISALTALAPRAYELAGIFRQRGIPVILGGLHPTACPDEAAAHADAIVIGWGEAVWEALCLDLEAGTLKSKYDGTARTRKISVPAARRDIFTNRHYPQLDMIQFTRGCVYKCHYCSVHAFAGGRFLQRDIDEVRAEFPNLRRWHLMVADDDIYGDRDYALKAFRALAPLKKYTGIQTTMDMAFDDEVMDAARDAKVRAVFVGLETVSMAALAESNKRHNIVAQYADAMRRFHDRGMFVEVGLMFGFDDDGPDVFDETLAMMDEIGADVAQIGIVTPMPGTPLYARLIEEGRIFDFDWSHYDCNHVVFRPARMSVDELYAGAAHCREKFYRRREIARRSLAGWKRFDLVTWGTQTALNLGFRKNHRLGLDYPP